MRGEYPFRHRINPAYKGSPPLAWGIQPKSDGKRTRRRITPTCVGNTSRPQSGPGLLQDHPHLRGEYGKGQGLNPSLLGSPPLAWGILDYLHDALEVDRITPTCVGNTASHYYKRDWREDHPHLRGEYWRIWRA